MTEHAARLGNIAERVGIDGVQSSLGEELSALALISLGSTEAWAGASADAKLHLERGVELARQIGRPYLTFTGFGYLAVVLSRSLAAQTDYGRRAIELARRHGWTEDPAFGVACAILGQDPYQEPVRQARHAWPGRGRRACPRPGTVRALGGFRRRQPPHIAAIDRDLVERY